MRRKIIIIISSVVIAIFILIGIILILIPPPMPELGISSEKINTYFILEAPVQVNQFRTDGIINISIKPTTDSSINLLPDYGARLFLLDDNKWIEIKNLMIYQSDNFLLPPIDPTAIGIATVFPDIPDVSHPVRVRVVFMGYVVRDGITTDELVASYVDVKLKP